jgi:excisionase family DNA binding protein
MAALKSPARSWLRPPTEAESRLALESSRRLGPTLADLPAPNEGNGAPHSVEISVHVPGKPSAGSLTIPAAALRLLGYILTEMAQGNVVTLTPIHAELTTKQAADLLNVSRPFLCKVLDNGKIPHRKVGRHRRVKYVDLMEYKKSIDDARSLDLDELVEEAQELDMGY